MEAASMDDEAEFKLFYKQEEALEYIATAGPEFRIFSREKKVGGSRVHQVYPSCQHFCEAYANYEDSYKTFYEVIPVGCPAKLYFDLEFPKELNPHSDGEKMVKIFLAAVEAALEMDFSSRVSLDFTDAIHLDASTPAKFSQHIIYPKVVFRDLFHAKIFVERLYTNITSVLRDQAKAKEQGAWLELKINTGRELALFVDKSVYGRKQNFRIFQSSKFGKNNPLIRAAGHVSPGHVTEKTDQEILLQSLITNTAAVGSSRFLEYPEVVVDRFSRLAGRPKSAKTSVLSGSCPSPFPQLDRFFQNIVGQAAGHEGQSEICKWEFESQRKIFRFFISGAFQFRSVQFCENFRTNHEEKGVLFIVELKTKMYWLRCLDPGCGKIRPEKKHFSDDFIPFDDAEE